MSFGVGIGDVIAVLKLSERIARELRNYRDAPSHFEQAALELSLFHRALTRLLKIQPHDADDKESLDEIRLIAIQCQRPLLSFTDKMKPREGFLGLENRRSSMALTSISNRLHWSLIARKDLDELRKVVVGAMTAINMMLAMQQLSSLRKPACQKNISLGPEMNRLIQDSEAICHDFRSSMGNLKDLQGTKSRSLHETCRQTELGMTDELDVEEMSAVPRTIVQQNNCLIKASQSIQNSLAQSIMTITEIARDVQRVLSTLGTFSQELLNKIAVNGQLLLGIHKMLKRLLIAIESIPLHLTLGIVRLDDALGESWALPYQACQTLSVCSYPATSVFLLNADSLQSFKNILQVVVFGNNRPGARRVLQDQILLRSAKDGVILREQNWATIIKQGAHVSQAMVLQGNKDGDKQVGGKQCPFPGCFGLVDSSSKACAACGRQSTFEKIDASLFAFETATVSTHHEVVKTIARPASARSRKIGPIKFSKDSIIDVEVELFRNVHYTETRDPITSIEEAQMIWEADPNDTRALRYFACWLLYDAISETALDHIETAIKEALIISRRAVDLEPFVMDNWYILGRVHQRRYETTPPIIQPNLAADAYTAYQQAVYLNGRCAPLWNSIGTLYHRMRQYRDSFDALTRSIRLNPHAAYVWRNMGILYDHCEQYQNAIDAYERAWELNHQYQDCRLRSTELKTVIMTGQDELLPSMDMEDYYILEGLRGNRAEIYDESLELHFAPLNLNEDDEGADTDVASGQRTPYISSPWEDEF